MADSPSGLALFDLDSTLLPIDSDHAWNEWMIGRGWVDAPTFRAGNERFYADYQEGRLDIAAYVAFATAPLRGQSATVLDEAHAGFMREVIGPAIRPAALELIDRHAQAGDRLAIVTATSDFIVAPIVRAFGLDVRDMIATRLERDGAGRPTGRIDGTPSFREGKVARVRQWLAESGGPGGDALDAFSRIVVYSDSPNDLPLLEIATEPVATNPAPALAAIARERGWRILELFKASN